MKLRELLQQMMAVQEKIGASKAYICGGTPRDRYLKHLENISDIDITTGDKTVSYLSQEFGKELSEKYNVTIKNMDDGHSAIYIGSFKMDFSSNFNAPNIDTLLKQMGINNPTEMQKEMFSRDFTCNALLLSLDLNNVVDPTHKGFKDINDRVIRTCLDPEITLTTNRNRVVRAIYLASKLDFTIDPKIIEFVQKNPQTVKISTEKAMAEKLNEAFKHDADKASHYLTVMNLWKEIPITESIRPYYFKSIQSAEKKAYFQGGGGVSEPEPKKKKYPSDKAILVQPRFKEPFYKNYDIYNVPGIHDEPTMGPGAGWHSMQKYKSVSEFLKARRQHMRDKYKADDSWIEDNWKNHQERVDKMKTRASVLNRIIKMAGDENDGPNYDLGAGLYQNMDKYKSVEDFRENKPKGQGAFYKADDNNIDFPDDQYIAPEMAAPEGSSPDGDNPVGAANMTGGYLDEALPENDFEEKDPTTLDFGRDYVTDTKSNMDSKEILPNDAGNLDNLGDHGLFGLPDGVNLPDGETGDPNTNPDFGTTDLGITMYEDKWNI